MRIHVSAFFQPKFWTACGLLVDWPMIWTYWREGRSLLSMLGWTQQSKTVITKPALPSRLTPCGHSAITIPHSSVSLFRLSSCHTNATCHGIRLLSLSYEGSQYTILVLTYHYKHFIPLTTFSLPGFRSHTHCNYLYYFSYSFFFFLTEECLLGFFCLCFCLCPFFFFLALLPLLWIKFNALVHPVCAL